MDFDEMVASQKAAKPEVVDEAPSEEERGYINWWEFAPQGDTFIVHTTPDETKKVSESGIIISTENDVIQDRPFKGTVVSVGPEAKVKVGTYIYFQPISGMDLAMIRRDKPEDSYLLLYPDAVLGIRVKDTRD